MDILTSERRSWNMSRICCSNTMPERIVRSVLHRLGFRFRIDSGKKLFGKPDIVLPRYRTVVFVHGCYWHRHRGCRYAYMPKSRIEFWQSKFDSNVRRDLEVKKRLRSAGWKIVTVWECQAARLDRLIGKFLRIKSDAISRSKFNEGYMPQNFPLLPRGSSVNDAKVFMKELVGLVGAGFHPDTDFKEYVSVTSGRKIFSTKDADRLNQGLSRAMLILQQGGIEPYAVALKSQRKLLNRAVRGNN